MWPGPSQCLLAKSSEREIARRCAVTHPFVATIRAEVAPTGNGFQSEPRHGADGHTINTANIGRAPNAQEDATMNWQAI
jgi:hypothetical protein